MSSAGATPPSRIPAPGPLPERPDALRDYSPTVTFRDLQRKNRRTSVVLVLALLALAMTLGGAISLLFGAGLAVDGAGADVLDPASLARSVGLGAAAALALSLIGTLWAWYGGAGAILAITGAEPITRAQDPVLYDIIDGLRIAAGLPMPRVYEIDSRAMNAFATGRDPEHASVAVTTGLRAALTRDELQGVMAHEMAHVRNLDIRVTMLTSTMVGLIVMVCDMLRRGIGRGPTVVSTGKRKDGGVGLIIALVVVLALSIIAPMLATIIHLAVSRQREYLADAGAVELTRNPEGLINALRKLASCREPLDGNNRATEHLFIVRPWTSEGADLSLHEMDSVFSTHPPLSERIRRLQALLR